MFACNMPLAKAVNGNNRGYCSRFLGHNGKHGNNTCRGCGVVFAKENTRSSIVARGAGLCRDCERKIARDSGVPPFNKQIAGNEHTFPCGCVGFLPKEQNESNKFAVRCESWVCRVLHILHRSARAARTFGHAPINPDTPHFIIRELMEEPNCERCGLPLEWKLEAGKTPHLHHNHRTGEIYGFTHSRCNPNALENEVERLKEENKKLKEIIMLESKSTGTDSKQNRSDQPKRAGGNSSAFGIEKHGSKRGERIAICGVGGAGEGGHGEVGCNTKETTSPRIEGGNTAKGESTDKHNQPKAMGKKYVGGKSVGAAPVVDSNIQVSERRHGAGNDDDGAHEKGCQEKATRLDMSVKRFDR